MRDAVVDAEFLMHRMPIDSRSALNVGSSTLKDAAFEPPDEVRAAARVAAATNPEPGGGTGIEGRL